VAAGPDTIKGEVTTYFIQNNFTYVRDEKKLLFKLALEVILSTCNNLNIAT